jgi:hypothetical protein
LDRSVDDIYIAEMYSVDEFSMVGMTDLIRFVADDLTIAKIRCEAWISCSSARGRSTHVRLRRQSRVVYLRSIPAALKRGFPVPAKGEKTGSFDVLPNNAEAVYARRLSALRALAG